MLLTCPHCRDASEIPDDRLPPAGARGACRACGRTVVFAGDRLAPEGGEDDATPPNPLAPETGSDDATPPNPLQAEAGAAGATGAGAAQAGDDAWHVNTPAGQQGPLTLADLKTMIRSGDLTDVDHVYGPGQTDWMLAGDRDELRRYFAIKARTAAAATAAAGATASGAPKEIDLFAQCTRHPQAEAEWICHSCSVSWCPSCAVPKKLPGGEVWTCPQCERPVARREKKKDIVPWWTELGKVFAYPVGGLRWIAILVLCGVWFMQFLSSGAAFYGAAAGWILSFGILSWYLLVIRHVGEGREGMPDSGNVENWMSELFVPGLKAAVVTFVAFLPLLLYSLFIVGPAMGEYAAAQAFEEAAPEEELLEAIEETPGAATPMDEQREALVEAMRQMGATEEEIDAMLEEFDAEAGGGSSGGEAWEDDGGWEEPEPWRPEPPSGASVFLKVLGIPVLMIYTLAVWPLLMIIVAMFNTIAPAFNPPLLLRIVQEVGPAYRRLMLFLAPLMLVELALDWVAAPDLGTGARMMLLGFPMGARIIFVPLLFYVQIVIMYVIGRTAEIIDNEIDWF